ncbi:MAG TPA: hypothetical protein VJJ73_02050 [Candidatus Paceibacterota bacterium]
MSKGPGVAQRKILLLILGGIMLSLSNSPKGYFRTIRKIRQDWKKINKQTIRNLYQSRLIDVRENSDDTVTIILTEEGKKKALTYKIEDIEIKKPKRWDGKWRVVVFDIPEKSKQAREAFRYHLKNLQFHEFQKSVFVHPFDCKDEVDYIVEFYDIRKFVRFIIAESIDNGLHLEKIYGL